MALMVPIRDSYAFGWFSLCPAFDHALSADLVLFLAGVASFEGGLSSSSVGFGSSSGKVSCSWGEYLVNSLSKRIGQAISHGRAWVAHPVLKEADHHAGDLNAVRQSLLG